MKNLAKLTLFFSLCFVIFLLAAILSRLLSSWIDVIRFIPVRPVPGEDAAALAWKALPAAIYLSLLFGVSYTARRKMPVFSALICLFVLGCAFSAGVSIGLKRAGALKPALNPVSPLRGAPGLILSRPDTAMILLKESSEIRGPRVVSIPGRPLVYQEVPRGPNNTVLSLPALPFGVDPPWFVRSLAIDFSLSAGELERRLDTGFLPFAAYAFALVLLLGSLRFLLELSEWPLANLFLGALVFRMVLSLETFINAGEINALIASFLEGRVPPDMITPLVFAALAALFILYTLLARISRPAAKAGSGRNGDD